MNEAAWPYILLQHGSNYVVAAWHKSNTGSMASLQPETLPVNEAAWPYTVAAWQ